MTKDDIHRMARESGFEHIAEADYWHPFFERFAAFVAAAEREACAADAEWCIQNHLEHLIPERIRARGESK